MELISIIKDFVPKNDPYLLDKAKKLAPELHREDVIPVSAFYMDENGGREEIDLAELPEIPFGKDSHVCLDFGTHRVGYFRLELGHKGSHPDAPALIFLKFAETYGELLEDTFGYSGWLAKGWIQEELLHVDTLPAGLELSRRFAFRYVKITVIDTSPKYQLSVQGASCQTVTSADWSRVRELRDQSSVMAKIDKAALVTLANCMQEVFEDGPKRDQRLWLGDLRLQAISNYVTFRNYDLVKRCLYYFGGSRFPDGRVSACVFTKLDPASDDTYMFDYAMMFIVVLEEYVRETGDMEALDDLYGIAMEQIDYALAQCGKDGVVGAKLVKESFFDWCDDLDRTACTQGVLIYAAGYASSLAQMKGDEDRAASLRKVQEKMKKAAFDMFWDEKAGCFVSGTQAAPHSQIWMILAGVPDKGRAVRAAKKAALLDNDKKVRMRTPYMHHYYVEALLAAGLVEEALTHISSYWGSMIEAGADTFFESWDPESPEFSPYGGKAVDSSCHSWSCTPTYFLRKRLSDLF